MGKNNAQFLNWDNIKAIKAENKGGVSIKKLSQKYKIGVVTTANAIKATSLAHFKQLQQERSQKEVANKRAKRAAAVNNAKQTDKAAAKVKADLLEPYTPTQTKQLIDGLVAHTENLEERLQTVTSLLIESDDNIVSRIYKLEKPRFIRRFLERF